MACCKSGRRSKRLRRNNPVLQRADCGTGATPEPVAQTYYRTQLANCAPSPSTRRARRLRNVRYRSMTRALLLRDDCVMEESGWNACAKMGARPMRERRVLLLRERGACGAGTRGEFAGDNEWQSTVVLDPVFRPSRPPVQR
ncbi:unnamed protein product [Spodoptera exigua]|nr:unnamed protein product [Spodoptera exigua]